MNHAITVRDLLVISGAGVAVVALGGFALWFLAQLNSDI